MKTLTDRMHRLAIVLHMQALIILDFKTEE